MTDLHPVRVTMEPGVVREVTDAELVDLARQGLIHSYKHTPAARVVLSGTVPVHEKWQGPTKGEAVVTAGPDLAQPDAAPVAPETFDDEDDEADPEGAADESTDTKGA